MRSFIRLLVCGLVSVSLLAQPGPPKCTPAPAGLTAWWSFTEPAGSPARDRIPADNVATPAGGFTSEPAGPVGAALCFSGNGTLTAADHNDLDFLGACPSSEPLTIDFWIRTTQTQGVVTVLDKRVRGPNFIRGWSVYLVAGRPGFQLATGPGAGACGSAPTAACTNYAAPGSIADGNWHLVAIRVSPRCGANAKGTISVDGAVVFTFAPRQGDISNNAPLTFGSTSANFGGAPFRGCLDEVEIAKREFTDEELLAIYKARPAGKCTPCVVPPSECPAGKPFIGMFTSPTGAGWGKGTYAVCLESTQKADVGWCSAAYFPNTDRRCDDYKGFSTVTTINNKKYCVFNRTDSTYYNAREMQP